MDVAEPTVGWIDNVVSVVDKCINTKKGKILVLLFALALTTFDLVSDWMNYSSAKNLKTPVSMEVFENTFLFAAIAGSVLYFPEMCVLLVTLHRTIKENKVHVCDEASGAKEERSKLETLRLVTHVLIGLFEDYPVLLVTMIAAGSFHCVQPIRNQLRSASGTTAIVASIISSLFTLISLLIPYCKACGCCGISKPLRFWQRLLMPFILFAFLSGTMCGFGSLIAINVRDGTTTIYMTNVMYKSNELTSKISERPSSFNLRKRDVEEQDQHFGPGFDANADGFIFFYQHFQLGNSYQVNIHSDGSGLLAKTPVFDEFFNRIYVGSFAEVIDGEDPVIRVVSCDIGIPFRSDLLSKYIVQEWERLENSQCNLMFRLQFSGPDTLALEYGIQVKNNQSCIDGNLSHLASWWPDDFNSFPQVMDNVAQDIAHYTCRSFCNKTKCPQEVFGELKTVHDIYENETIKLVGSHVVIHNVATEESCRLYFDLSSTLDACSEPWIHMEPDPGSVPPAALQYPQFITAPRVGRTDSEGKELHEYEDHCIP